MKHDYKLWDAIFKTANVGKSIRLFDSSFDQAEYARHIEGFTRHTDEFCYLVHCRDYKHLGSQLIEKLDALGLMEGCGYVPPNAKHGAAHYYSKTYGLDSPHGPDGKPVPFPKFFSGYVAS